MDVIELVSRLDTLLEPWKFKDYCPNGLQVEGARRIERVVCGVTASQALLDEAVRLDADAVLVHHGYFWKGEPAAVTGIKRQRLATLLANNLHLLAYHLRWMPTRSSATTQAWRRRWDCRRREPRVSKDCWPGAYRKIHAMWVSWRCASPGPWSACHW